MSRSFVHRSSVAALFPGQGSHGPAMGVSWRNHEAWSLVEQAEAISGHQLQQLLLDPQLYPRQPPQTHLAVVTCSLMAWSALTSHLSPAVVAGHSLGLISALHAAGALPASEALRIVCLRAEITRKAIRSTAGGMAALLAPLDVAHASCAGEQCWVANDNSPVQSVLSGSASGLQAAIQRAWRLDAWDVIPLDIEGPYHTPLMRQAAAEFAEQLKEVDFRPTHLPVMHNAHLYPAGEDAPWGHLLADDLQCPVLWRENQLHLASNGIDTVMEVGYGDILIGLARRTLPRVTLISADSPEITRIS
ncbi:ACP S-malonyltransferase [Umezawaea endophytica]|uniref:ACP S-malonyltransferase n=1 Tax=Umezawaea endophytica TaxID=1654476 RepID=UPI0035560074